VQALIEQLEQGHSEALTAYLTAMGRFHTYSFGNILEIARQKPDATHWPLCVEPVWPQGLEMAARNRSIKPKDDESVAKLLTAFVRKADEGTIGKLIIEAVILLSAKIQADGGKTLRAAAQVYGIDTDAMALKVKQEFVAKAKARTAAKSEPKAATKKKRAA